MSIDKGPRFKFRNLDEDEETTKIEEIRGLRFSFFKALIVSPVLSLASGLIFALALYWYPAL